MSWDSIPGRNSEGYPDPTAATALANVQRSQRGRQSRIMGDHFEGIIAASLKWYEDKGVACIEKTPEPMKPLRAPNRQGQFLACYIKAGQPDFKGTLTGGRSVVFEAKHTDSDRIEYSRLTDEQVEKLSTHHKLGAAAFVLVSFGLQDFYRIPWEIWRDMKAIYGHKHIKQTELEPYRVQYIAGVLKLLEGIELDYNEEKEQTHE
ncbi:MAG: Holliday junction resolvase RecU [Muribaculaceae bacterium]|nr:Holliday junction resolvase RecU [Muribaculaceae bacterium]